MSDARRERLLDI
jgi:hypothetical protein